MHGIYWGYVYGIVVDTSLGIDAEVIQQKLGAKKIGTQPFFWCMHEQPVLHAMGYCKQGREPCVPSCPLSLKTSSSPAAVVSFYVPSGLALTDEQIERVAKELRATETP